MKNNFLAESSSMPGSKIMKRNAIICQSPHIHRAILRFIHFVSRCRPTNPFVHSMRATKKSHANHNQAANENGNARIRWMMRGLRLMCTPLSCSFHNYFSVVFNQVRCQLDFIGFPFFSIHLRCSFIGSVAMRSFGGSFLLE